jgi:hypothetical protein
MRVLARILVPVVSLAVGVAVVALPGGCGKSAPPLPTTVRGRVTFQGQPVAGGLVVFTPDPARGFTGKPARGETGPDGSFTLLLDGRDHIPAGWYRVALADAPALDPAASFGKPAFPPQLGRPDRSGLVREVVAGKEHVFEFGVEVPK